MPIEDYNDHISFKFASEEDKADDASPIFASLSVTRTLCFVGRMTSQIFNSIIGLGGVVLYF